MPGTLISLTAHSAGRCLPNAQYNVGAKRRQVHPAVRRNTIHRNAGATFLQQVRHRGSIPRDCREMVGRGAALDPLVMATVEGGVSRDVRHARSLPERDLTPPVLLQALTRRDPYLEPYLGRIAAGFPRQLAQLLERSQRRIAGRIVQRHESITVLAFVLDSNTVLDLYLAM